jgi:hypothetical protein
LLLSTAAAPQASGANRGAALDARQAESGQRDGGFFRLEASFAEFEVDEFADTLDEAKLCEGQRALGQIGTFTDGSESPDVD